MKTTLQDLKYWAITAGIFAVSAAGATYAAANF